MIFRIATVQTMQRLRGAFSSLRFDRLLSADPASNSPRPRTAEQPHERAAATQRAATEDDFVAVHLDADSAHATQATTEQNGRWSGDLAALPTSDNASYVVLHV